MRYIGRRAFLASAPVAAAVAVLPALSIAQIGPFTPEALGGDLNAAIAALPDGGRIDGGKWWVRDELMLVGHGKQLVGLEIVFQGAVKLDTRAARGCIIAYCFLRSGAA